MSQTDATGLQAQAKFHFLPFLAEWSYSVSPAVKKNYPGDSSIKPGMKGFNFSLHHDRETTLLKTTIKLDILHEAIISSLEEHVVDKQRNRKM